MSYQCVIIDDEPLARELLEGYLQKLPDFELVASCSSALDATTVLSTGKVDLLFLDIEMPVLKGTDFFKNLVQQPQVIFTTAYRDYAVDGFELNALDYLLKPIFFERFFSSIQKFLALKRTSEREGSKGLKTDNNQFLFVSKAKKQIKVVFDSVLYIESFKDYIKIHLQEETLTIKESISNFEKRLDKRFIRLHRSYIVNSEKITAYTKNDVEIGRREIPIGNNYKDNMLPFLKSI
ncbi:LytTR family DNA-binding domain-containing protein [uncultured Croceitalea sp.]|uniref:LytR/AlgR family response regulator transcription factor n=1 Tax=uncultured Croceitalea sp. TaxID=1798908 RepID=UPI0033055D2B